MEKINFQTSNDENANIELACHSQSHSCGGGFISMY